MESVKEMWELVRGQLRAILDETIYDIWFAPLELLSFEGNRVEIAASEFRKKIIEQRFLNELKEAFMNVMGFEIEVILTNPENAASVEKKEDDEEISNPPAMSLAANTFDSFVVGQSNRFAHAAAQAVASAPGMAYNPLFIHGNSGLGKTHLLCAISNEIKKNNPDADIIFTKGEDFVNLIIDGIHNNKMHEIHQKYRKCDILLVDDIQFIAGKASTQEEFFHTFNALTQEGKQIVLTSDRSPKDIDVLDDRLRSRFESGLLADIQPPDVETRMAIVQKKAKSLGLELPSEVVSFIAEKIKANIRQLEGAVKKINALVNIERVSVNIAIAQSAIKDILTDSRPVSVIVNRIISETARTYGVPEEDIISKKKDAKTARARHVAIYTVRENTDLTQKEISSFFGGRDRTTILHSIESMTAEVERDPTLRKTIEAIMKNAKEQ